MEDNRTPIPVTLYIFTDERNREIILPDPTTLESEIAQYEQEKAKAELLNPVPETKVVLLTELIANTRVLLEEFLPKAARREYVLLRPSYGTLTKYKKSPSVRKEMDDGTVVTNKEALLEALLPNCVQGMTPDQVNDLTPDTFVRLANELDRAMYPQVADLPFSSCRSATP